MYMSRLAALKEYTFMKALRENGFSVPEPIAHNRHTIVMSLVDAFPLRQIEEVPDPAGLYGELMALIVRLAEYGLIHGDFNEFNLLVEEIPFSKPEQDHEDDEDEASQVRLNPVLIDFPQMLSISHPNAQYYFDRDVECIKKFFERRFKFVSDEPGPYFEEAIKTIAKRLDVEVEATGFSKKMAKELEKYMQDVGVDGDRDNETATHDEENDGEAEEEEAWIRNSEEAQEYTNEIRGENVVASPPDPDVPATSVEGTFTALELKDQNHNPPTAPSVFSTRTTSSKAAAGWAI
jgi:RIO kinase 2